MHFISTVNPMSKSEGNIPVSLFSFNENLKFIRVSEDYQDTIRRVTRAFNIAENAVISLRISTLDVCKGRDVVVDESAYALMWTALDEISITVDEIAQAQTQTQVPEARGVRETLPTPADTPTAGQSETEADNVRIDYLNVVEEAPQREEETNEEPVEEPKATDEEEDFYPPPRSAAPVRELETTGDGDGSKLQRKFKPAGTGSILSDAGPSTTSADIIPVVKKEYIAQPIASTSREVPRRERSPQRPTPAPTGDDPRFDITITGPDDHIAQFKTRGKHPIRKVLAAACKSFSIPYDRAHLMLALSFEDDGGTQTEAFECPPEDTMSQCGVDTHSKLFIRVDEDNEEEEPTDSD